MNSLEQYDALIIGAGQAGPPLAERLTVRRSEGVPD